MKSPMATDNDLVHAPSNDPQPVLSSDTEDPVGGRLNEKDPPKAAAALSPWRRLPMMLSLAFFLPAVLFGKPAVQNPEDVILSKGFQAYMDEKDKVAMSYFEEVVRLNPKNEAAQRGLEKSKIRLKRKEDEQLKKARNLAESKVREGQTLAQTNDLVAAIDAYHAALDAVNNYKPAAREISSIRKRMTHDVKKGRLNLSVSAYDRGVLAYLDRDWAKAYKIWSDRSEIDPTNIPLRNATLRAEENFRKMMMAERADFFRRAARAFYEQGLYDKSIDSWNKLLTMKSEDVEALEGKVRAEEALLQASGKGRNSKVHDLLEQALEAYAQQNWSKSRDLFKQIVVLDPEFQTANEYITKLNEKLASPQYKTGGMAAGGASWRQQQPSNQGTNQVDVPGSLENVSARRSELESQLKRDPSNIRLQQELDKIGRMQDDESERIYKDGLIAYSQGNRSQAIQKWKQVLVINPDHKKALAALKKAKAEEERSDQPGSME